MELTLNTTLRNKPPEIETYHDDSLTPAEEDASVQHNPGSESDSGGSTEPTTGATNGSSGLGSSMGGEKPSKYTEGSDKQCSPHVHQRRRTKASPVKHTSWIEAHGTLNESTICAPKENRRMYGDTQSHQRQTAGEIIHNSQWLYCIPDHRVHSLHKTHHGKDGKVIRVRSIENNGLRCSPKTSMEDVDHFISRRRSTFFTASKEEASHASISFAAATTTTTFVGHKLDRYYHGHRSLSRRKWFTPEEVIKRYGSSLTEYERGEILHYKKIWYFGLGTPKTTGRNEPYNNGFDNKKGEYKTIRHDHIAYRYEVIETIGKGAFGEVVEAYDHRNQQRVALKIIRNRPNLHEQAKVEVKMLNILMHRDPKSKNFTLRIFDDFTFRSHPCIVCELIGDNLFEVLKQRDFRGLSTKAIRSITRCILKCLAILQEESIIHCDVKPENILLFPGEKAYVKLIDFGSSCRESEQSE
ncbi:Dual specificity tyrosine-phosphorylation-regulated kinase 4 [Taenia solium]|eukprot:TsM_000096300 transcript=TsM_000096300 gene=TsM_000096300